MFKGEDCHKLTLNTSSVKKCFCFVLLHFYLKRRKIFENKQIQNYVKGNAMSLKTT